MHKPRELNFAFAEISTETESSCVARSEKEN